MSRPAWKFRRDRAMTVVCETCGAWVGQPCLNVKTGQPIHSVAHATRLAETHQSHAAADTDQAR